MKRPSFQFYPGDWQSDLKLRRCSPAARGVWVDILCAFHDSDDGYGFLRWPLREIANTVGAAMAHVKELVDKGVLRGNDKALDEALIYRPRSGRKDGPPVILLDTQPGPLWYSKRLVVDDYVRTIRGESTRFGDDNGGTPNKKPKPAPKPTLGDGTSSSSSSSASQLASQAARAGASSTEDPPEANGHSPTAAGLACRAMREEGLAAVNPGDPRLLALIEQGATIEEFRGLAAEAAVKGKGFAWVLVALAGRRQEAGEIALAPLPAAVKNDAVEQSQQWLESERLHREQVAAERAARKAAA